MPLLRLILLVASAWLMAQPAWAQYGVFEGEVEVVWNEDHRTMTLLKDFAYVDPLKVRWEAPKGWKVDGASIPQFAWSLIGGPYEGAYRKASVIHDVACDKRERPWEAAHLAFYYAMLASGVEAHLASIMYAAVYWGGPRWPMVLHALKGDPNFPRDVAAIAKTAGFTSGADRKIPVEVVMEGGGRAGGGPTSSGTSTRVVNRRVSADEIRELALGKDVLELKTFTIPAPPIKEAQWQRLKAFLDEKDRSVEEIQAYKP